MSESEDMQTELLRLRMALERAVDLSRGTFQDDAYTYKQKLDETHGFLLRVLEHSPPITFSPPIIEVRDPTKLPAHVLTDEELDIQEKRIGTLWEDLRSDEEFDGHGGSPGEWMVERLDEIYTERRLRGR